MKKFAVLALMVSLCSPLLMAKNKKMNLNGWVSDMSCARKSAEKASGASHADCARKCAQNGEAIAFIADDRHVYQLDNPFIVRDLEGKRVAIVAEPAAGTDVLHIVSIMPKEDQVADAAPQK